MSQSRIEDQGVSAPSAPVAAPAVRWRRQLSRLLSLGLLAYILLAACVLVARHWILPDVDMYRPRIEQALGEALQREVRIDALSADWTGLHPQLSLRGLTLLDETGAPALRLEQVEAALGFSSLVRGELHLHRLDINGPDLRIHRDADGRLFVAGLEMQRNGERGGFMRWLLSQGQINIRGARLEWQDDQRAAAPVLQLSDVDARLDNFGRHHRFGLNARPPRELAESLELRAEVSLPDIDDPGSASGELFLSLLGADMAVWRHWVDYPVELPQGRGATRIWSRFAGERLTGVRGELALADVKLRLAPDLPVLDLASLSGLISAEQVSSERIVASARQLQLTSTDGLALGPISLDLRWQAASENQPARGDMSADALDLGALTRMSAYLPLSQAVRDRLQRHAARGWLRELDGGWTGELSAPASFRISARLDAIEMAAVGDVPGVTGLSGRIEGSDLRGTLQIDAPELKLSLPAVFPEADIPFSQFRVRGAWQRTDGATELLLESLSFRNAHAQGQAHGRYRTGERGGDIDIEARLIDADPRAVWRYLPHAVGPDTRDWLRTALAAGRAPEATLRLRGRLADFPFDQPGSGVFQVRVKAEDATLDFGREWPSLTGLRADVLFEGRRMLVTGREGRILNARIGPTTAEVPDLWAHEEVLLVKGAASGSTSEFLRYIDASPIAARIDGFTAAMRAEGNGKLQLGLTIPLRHSRDSRVEGEYSFSGNRLWVDASLPPLNDATGRIAFTDSSLTIRGAQATVLGFPMALDVTTAANGALNVEARGRASAEALRAQLGRPWMEALTGTAAWQGRIAVRRDASDLQLTADLAQMGSILPAPLGKPVGEPLTLRVERISGLDAREMARRGLPVVGPDRELLRVTAGRLGSADIVRHRGALERAAIGLPQMPVLPDTGIALMMSGDAIDLDALSRVFGAAGAAAGTADGPQLGRVQVEARNLKVAGHWLDSVKADGQRRGDQWVIDLASSQARGKVTWSPQGSGQVKARFERLRLDSPEDERAQLSSADIQDEPDELPALDIEADQFMLDGRQLGRLELRAHNERRAWLIDQITLTVPEGSFVGSGAWGRSLAGARGARETRVGFEIRASDAGRLLERLGHSGVLRRGTASLKGTLSWQGSPLSIDYLSLGGSFELKADDGQFSKINPGAGRLLGILSLQSLPRRISLDFRDVFSEGFAFDRVRGSVTVERGIMSTRDFELTGPAAQVRISGSADISAETQNLVVNVQPALSDSVSVGALIANPAVGVATYLAQKVLKDPLGQMFAFRYAVTGSWDDPAVSKLGEQPAASSAAPAH